MTDFEMDEYLEEMGTCCFCGDYCNPCSQSCGSCVREKTAIMFGWKKHNYLKRIVIFRNKTYTPENFRDLISDNKGDFDKPLPFNPKTCELSLLASWAGAKLE